MRSSGVSRTTLFVADLHTILKSPEQPSRTAPNLEIALKITPNARVKKITTHLRSRTGFLTISVIVIYKCIW